VVLDEDGAELDEVLCASVSAQCCTFLWRRYVPEPLLDWGSMRSRTSHVLERSIISDVFSLLYAEEKVSEPSLLEQPLWTIAGGERW